MKLNKKPYLVLKWTTRILATVIILFGLPFYFGYGNPLPFTNPDNSIMDNLWLTIFPLMFIGLGLGWKFERIGGFLVVIPILIGSILSLIVEKEIPTHMLIPFVIGVLYILLGYTRILKRET